MGTVFLGEIVGDLGFRQTVAVKVLDPAQLDGRPELRDALLDEANLMSKLQHPNIVQVHQFLRLSHEILGDTFGMAMEYVEGGTLSSALRVTPFGRLSLEAALAVAQDVATALAYAWSFRSRAGADPLHLIHRDLKPDNILLTRDGHVKVVDFGIAWAAQGRVGNTKTGMTKGTLAYMSPEQIRGHVLDTRSDLYALGVILYELVVGQPYLGLEESRPQDLAAIVFRASSIEYGERRDLLREILTAPLGAQGHGLSEEDADRWDALLGEMLERHPADRLESSEVLLDRLEDLAQTWRVRAGRAALSEAAVPPLMDAESTNRNKTDELQKLTTSGQRPAQETREQSRVAPTRAQASSGLGGGPSPRRRSSLLALLGGLLLLLLLWITFGQTLLVDSPAEEGPALPQGTDDILEVSSTQNWGDLRTYDNSGSIGMTALNNVMERLIPLGEEYGPGQLLELFEHDADYKVWRLRLRPGVLFHPHPCLPGGETREATGADLLYSLRLHRFSPETLDYVRSMGLDEDDVLTITLHEGDTQIIRRLWDSPLFPRELEGCDDPKNFKQPSATGPWRFTGPMDGRGLTLTRWSEWWNRDSLRGRLPGRLRFHRVRSASDGIQGVEQGRYDLFRPQSFTEPKGLVDQAAGLGGVSVAHDQLGCSDVELRLPISTKLQEMLRANNDLAWALTHAIDREKVVPLLSRYAVPWGRKLRPDQFGFDPSIPQRAFDLRLARSFYRKAKRGPVPKVVKVGVIERRLEAGKAFVAGLRDGGFPAEVVPLGAEAFWPAYYGGTVDIVLSIGGGLCVGDERAAPLEVSKIVDREDRRKAWAAWERRTLIEGNRHGVPPFFLGRFPAGTPVNFIFHGPRVKALEEPVTQQLRRQHRSHFGFVELVEGSAE